MFKKKNAFEREFPELFAKEKKQAEMKDKDGMVYYSDVPLSELQRIGKWFMKTAENASTGDLVTLSFYSGKVKAIKFRIIEERE